MTLLATGLSVAALLTGCSVVGAAPDPVRRAEPPPPPAACVLDGDALLATTGLTWVPDQSTATDTRCVYDPFGTGIGPAFMAVDIGPATDDAPTRLDTIAQLCEKGSRADLDAADGAFVCRFDGGNVYGALVRGGQVVTVSTSAVPRGTTYARLAVALTEQLRSIGTA